MTFRQVFWLASGRFDWTLSHTGVRNPFRERTAAEVEREKKKLYEALGIKG